MWEAFGCARLIVVGPDLDGARALVGRFAANRAVVAGAIDALAYADNNSLAETDSNALAEATSARIMVASVAAEQAGIDAHVVTRAAA
jgi:hypothetical protein